MSRFESWGCFWLTFYLDLALGLHGRVRHMWGELADTAVISASWRLNIGFEWWRILLTSPLRRRGLNNRPMGKGHILAKYCLD